MNIEKRVVLFIIDTLNTGGAERSLLDIVSRFKAYRPIVCYIYPGDTLKQEFERRGVETISLNIPPAYHFTKAKRALIHVVRKVRPVIIHSSLFKSDIVSRRVAPMFKIPLINSLVNNSYHPSRFHGAGLIMNVKLRCLQWFDAWTSGKPDLFISNSETIKQSNSKALGIPLEKIKVIYRGRSVDDFNIDVVRANEIRNELGIDENAKVLLNVSRLIHRKGQIELIRAFKIISENAILLIAGEGPCRVDLERAIQQLGLSGRVKLLGNRQDVPLLMKIADCFVFPSHYEGLPGVLIESMFAKLPIIASRIPENLECVTTETAYLYDPGDMTGLTAAIKYVLENALESTQKAIRAYDDACEKFEILRIAESYEAAYDELLNISKN